MGNWVSLLCSRLLAHQLDSHYHFGRRMADRPLLSIAPQPHPATVEHCAKPQLACLAHHQMDPDMNVVLLKMAPRGCHRSAGRWQLATGKRTPFDNAAEPAFRDAQVWPGRPMWGTKVWQCRLSPSACEVAAVPVDRRSHARVKAGFVCIEVSTRDLDDLNGWH